MGSLYGLLPSLQGSELWAPVLNVVYNVVIMGLQGFQIRGIYQKSIGSTVDTCAVNIKDIRALLKMDPRSHDDYAMAGTKVCIADPYSFWLTRSIDSSSHEGSHPQFSR